MKSLCEQLEDYFDGDLDANATALFEQHLEHCHHCQSELLELQQLNDTIRNAWLKVDIGSTYLNVGMPNEGQQLRGAGSMRLVAVAAIAALALIGLTIAFVFQPDSAQSVSDKTPSNTDLNDTAQTPSVDRAVASDVQAPTYQTVYAKTSFASEHEKHWVESNEDFTFVEIVPRF